MDLDQLPDLSRARLVRARARGTAIRDADRAVAVAFVADGSLLPADTLVRFDVTHGEDTARRLADALTATGARAIWFYGGDAVTRRAVASLDLAVRPAGAAFVDGGAPPAQRVVFRPPAQRERKTLPDLQRDHAPAFRAPYAEVAEIGGDAVGLVLSEALDQRWTELKTIVYPAHRGHGHGAAMLAAAAERLRGNGRSACAASESFAGRERTVLERAGFRLADYYFIAAKR
ncbi:MAG TPA: GNAT family N-acetyltransferase [Candidatus Elarobacter sp.]|jgi:GNAT superfamily N-acetyltransferase|nr:GNAT family N-acetyltransferase [Candidatus Elarobacter sp.]